MQEVVGATPQGTVWMRAGQKKARRQTVRVLAVMLLLCMGAVGEGVGRELAGMGGQVASVVGVKVEGRMVLAVMMVRRAAAAAAVVEGWPSGGGSMPGKLPLSGYGGLTKTTGRTRKRRAAEAALRVAAA